MIIIIDKHVIRLSCLQNFHTFHEYVLTVQRPERISTVRLPAECIFSFLGVTSIIDSDWDHILRDLQAVTSWDETSVESNDGAQFIYKERSAKFINFILNPKKSI